MLNGIGEKIGCFLAGAVAGGIVVALATPYSGPKARRILRNKVQDGTERLSEAVDDWKREVFHSAAARG